MPSYRRRLNSRRMSPWGLFPSSDRKSRSVRGPSWAPIVPRDVPPYVMVPGNPAEPHAVNSEGLKRRGFTEEQIRNIREAYRILYRCDLRLTEAVEKLQALAVTQPEIATFV